MLYYCLVVDLLRSLGGNVNTAGVFDATDGASLSAVLECGCVKQTDT